MDLLGLTGIFQTIADHEQTGTLKVQAGDREVYIYFKTGQVQSVAFPHKRSLLAESVMRCSKIPKKILEQIFAKQRQTKKSLLATLKNMELGNEALQDQSFIVRICHTQISEEIYDIFSWDDVHCQFLEDEIPENIFDPEMLNLPIAINPGALVMEAARRQDEWSVIRKVLPSNKDIAFTTQAVVDDQVLQEVAKEEGQEIEVIRKELLSLVNGIRDFDEIIEQVRMSAFTAIKLLAKLTEKEQLALKTAEELQQMASYDILQQDIYKCIRLYERVEELGLKNLETMKWLARAYEKSGLTNKAVEKYRDLGTMAIEEGLYEEGVRAYNKVVEFAPEDLESYEKLINAYNKYGKRDKAAEVSAIYARKVAVDDKRKAIMVLDEANKNYPSSPSNLELMATLYQQMNDKKNAILTYNILANLMRKQEDLERALQAYHKILAIDITNTKAHLEIAKGMIELGKTAEGVVQYKELGQLLVKYINSEAAEMDIDQACDILMQVCEAIILFESDNIIAREWLVDACIFQKDEESAIQILRELLSLLQKKDDLPVLVTNLQKIVVMAPEDFASRKLLADTLLRLNESNAAINEYMQLGLATYEKNDMRKAREAFEAIINIDPFSLVARQKRAEILGNLNLQAKAVEEYKLVGYLSKSVERIPDAIHAFSRMVELAPEKELWGFLEVARLCEVMQENTKAIAHYKTYAIKNLAHGNYGEVHYACSRILALEPGNAEATAMKKQAEERFTTLSTLI